MVGIGTVEVLSVLSSFLFFAVRGQDVQVWCLEVLQIIQIAGRLTSAMQIASLPPQWKKPGSPQYGVICLSFFSFHVGVVNSSPSVTRVEGVGVRSVWWKISSGRSWSE